VNKSSNVSKVTDQRFLSTDHQLTETGRHFIHRQILQACLNTV